MENSKTMNEDVDKNIHGGIQLLNSEITINHTPPKTNKLKLKKLKDKFK